MGTSPFPQFYTGVGKPTDLADIESRQHQDQQLQHHLQQQLQLIPKQDISDLGLANNHTNNIHNKPALMPPTMFLSSSSSSMGSNPPIHHNGLIQSANDTNSDGNTSSTLTSLNNSKSSNNVSNIIQPGFPKFVPAINSYSTNSVPEPLTQNQLIQAMNYLIKNDAEFVRKLHEAYLKSFTEMVSL